MDDGRRSIRRHRFTPQVRRAAQACCALDNWHGPLEILEHWLTVLAATYASALALERLSPVASVPLLAVATFVIGGRQRALAGVVHQACHGTLTANRRMGRLLAAVFSGFPLFQSVSGYAISHTRDHHGHFGNPNRDPDYQFFLRAGLYGKESGRATLRRHLAAIPGPRSTLRYITFLVRHRILDAHARRSETVLRLAIYAAVFLAATWYDVAWIVVLFWLLPLVTTQVWIGSLAELLEHYPLMDRQPTSDIHLSRNREFGPLWALVLGEKRGEGYHLVHHLFPNVPLWKLHKVHRILSADPTYARLDVARTPLAALRAIEASLPGST